MKLILTAAISAIVGGSGLGCLMSIYLRHFLEKRLNAKELAEQERRERREAEERRRREIRTRRLQIEDELHHAYGRLFFWLHRAVVTGQHNGELEAAMKTLQEVEGKKKDLDREILAESEQD